MHLSRPYGHASCNELHRNAQERLHDHLDQAGEALGGDRIFCTSQRWSLLVGCYTADDDGRVAAHRDNTTRGIAHRRFAASISLNDDFDGGEVSFPEYAAHGFKPPVGGAVVFSCALMHAVSAESRGGRCAFLSFLYDEFAARIRAANNQFLDPSVGSYKGG